MTEPITSTLEDAARDTTGAALQNTLVDLIDLSLVAKQAHWNLVGRQFHDVHLHLDELVAVARDFSDKVAERAAAIGVSPDGRARTVSDASTVPSFAEGWARDRDVVRYVYRALDAVVAGVRPRLADTEKTDPVTQDLLIALVAALEEARWMWQAQAAGYEDDKS
ncbi:MAG: DNA starvation/stationary phase protection protein [Pseudonocardia sp.]|nr:DNA starvation/stationary phase protection protein [Pseudonocardia sp.]